MYIIYVYNHHACCTILLSKTNLRWIIAFAISNGLFFCSWIANFILIANGRMANIVLDFTWRFGLTLAHLQKISNIYTKNQYNKILLSTYINYQYMYPLENTINLHACIFISSSTIIINIKLLIVNLLTIQNKCKIK